MCKQALLEPEGVKRFASLFNDLACSMLFGSLPGSRRCSEKLLNILMSAFYILSVERSCALRSWQILDCNQSMNINEVLAWTVW